MQYKLKKFGLLFKTVIKKMVTRDPFFAYAIDQDRYIHPGEYTMKQKIRKYKKR